MCVFNALCLHFQLIFIVVYIAHVPDCVLSRGFNSEKRNVTNASTESSSSKSHILQPHKHVSRNKRPAVHIKERGPVKLTKLPTNSKQVRLFGRVGLFLYVNANGTVSGSLNQRSKFGEYGNLNVTSYITRGHPVDIFHFHVFLSSDGDTCVLTLLASYENTIMYYFSSTLPN